MNEENLERFSRHILLENIGIEGQLSIQNAKVLVLGCGGIANGLLPYLASSGVGTIGIVDYDVVELSNLQRQILFSKTSIGKSKILEARDFLTQRTDGMVKIYDLKITPSRVDDLTKIMHAYDVFIDTTDSFETRCVINAASARLQKPLFSAAAIGFEVQVYGFYSPSFWCYNCLYSEINETRNCANSGVFAPCVGLAGTFLASYALQFIAGASTEIIGKILSFNLLTNKLRLANGTKDPNCKICQ
jgi:molybdopterin/thiamine biosynthesis adenylyltransferase